MGLNPKRNILSFIGMSLYKFLTPLIMGSISCICLLLNREQAMDISENKSYSQQEDDYLPPIVSSYNDETILPPLFDCADKLRRSLNVMQQCIQPPPVPTIVLVGDRCSGKSSLIASLIGIKITLKGHFCTQLPVLIKLQNHHSRKLEVSLEFDGKTRTQK